MSAVLSVISDKVTGDSKIDGIGGGLEKNEAYILIAITIFIMILSVAIISYIVIKTIHKSKNKTTNIETKIPEPKTEYCHFCGKEIEKDSIYCKQCGNKLE